MNEMLQPRQEDFLAETRPNRPRLSVQARQAARKLLVRLIVELLTEERAKGDKTSE